MAEVEHVNGRYAKKILAQLLKKLTLTNAVYFIDDEQDKTTAVLISKAQWDQLTHR